MPTDPQNNRYPVPVPRGEGPYDQYINSAMDALATDVPDFGPVSARPAANSEFAPIRYFATDEQTEYFNAGNEWISISGVAKGLQAPQNGHIVPIGVGLGTADAINPASATNPINDAINTVEATGRGGYVILPPGNVTQNDSIMLRPGVSVFGAGIGKFPGEESTKVEITDTTAPLIATDGTASQVYGGIEISDFHIMGQGRGTHAAHGIHLGDPAGGNEKVRGFHIGDLRLEGFDGALLRQEPGGEMWASRIEHLVAQNYNPSAGVGDGISLDYRDKMSVANMFGIIDAYPNVPGNEATDPLTDFVHIGAAGHWHADNLNIGGDVDAILEVDTDYAIVDVTQINYEIHQQESVTRSRIVDSKGESVVRVGMVNQRTNAPVEAVYRSATGNDIFGPVNVGFNKTVPTNVVALDAAPTEQVIYFGPAEDIDYNGHNNRNVVALTTPAATPQPATATSNATHDATYGEIVMCDTTSNNVTITLPAGKLGAKVSCQNIQSSGQGDMIIETPGAATIDGNASVTVTGEGSGRVLVCDGVDWWSENT